MPLTDESAESLRAELANLLPKAVKLTIRTTDKLGAETGSAFAEFRDVSDAEEAM